MATLRAQVHHQHYPKPPSTPPPSTPPSRTYSPGPSPLNSAPPSPRDQSDWQHKERDRLLWQARWKAYEDRKASWAQTQWAEYEKRKQGDAVPRGTAVKGVHMDRNAAQMNGPSGEAGQWSSAPSSRSSSVDARQGNTPFAPKPARSGSFNYGHSRSGSESSRCTTPATPPPRHRTTPQAFTQIRPEPINTAPSSPNYQAFTAPARRMTSSPAPSRSSTPASPSPLASNLSIPRSFMQASSNPATQPRPRSNTNPTAPRPTIFIPKASALSDGDSATKTNPPDAEERQRRMADEKRRVEQAAEYVLRRNAEVERLRLEEERRRLQQQKAQSDARRNEKREAEALRLQLERTVLEQRRATQSAWEAYEERWRAMHDGHFPLPGQYLSLADIPWPVYNTIRSVNELSDDRLEAFLLSKSLDGTLEAKVLKQRVRDAMLRFHPDRFEGRWMPHVLERDRPSVKEGVGRVVRFLNELSTQLA